MVHPDLDSVPAALFSPRKLLGYTGAFARLFFPDPDGKPPSLTLKTFLGARHVALARDIRQLGEGNSYESEVPLHAREGDRMFRILATVGRHDDEWAVTLVLQDVHAYAETVRRLEESEARARAFVETSAAAIALVRNGRFDYVNRGFLELFGYLLREDLVGKEVLVCAAGKDRRQLAERAAKPFEDGVSRERLEFIGKRKDGARFHLQLLDEAVSIDGVPASMWYMVDITHLRSAQEEVLQHRKENDILDHLLATLHGTVDRTVLVRDGLSACIRWLGYESGCILTVSRGNDDAFILSNEEHLPEQLRSALAMISATEGLGGYLVKTMEAVQYTLETYPAFLPYRTVLEAEGIQTIACLPLAGRDRPAGIVILLTRKAPSPEDSRTAFLDLVARHFGFALDRAMFYESTQERADAYRTTIESLSGVAYETGPDGLFRYCSPTAERLTGYSVRDLTATPEAWRSMVHPDDRSILLERISRQASGVEEFVLHYRILPKGKASYRWVRDAVQYRRDAEGRVLAVCGLQTDVTDEKSEEQDLKRAEEIMRGVVDAMGDALVMTDLEGRVLEVNGAFTTLTGFGRAEVLGTTLPYPWIKEEEMGTFVQWLTALREQKRLKDFDMRWVRRDGAEVAISLSTSLLRNRAGEPVAILNLARDIGERRRHGDEIMQHNRQLALLNAIGQGLTGVLDRRSIFRVVHEHLSDAFGYDWIAFEVYDSFTQKMDTIFSAGIPGSAESPAGPARTMLRENDPFSAVIRDQEPYHGERGAWPNVLAVPVAAKDAGSGVLWVARRGGDPYDDLHLRIVTSIGNLVAIALDRVALYEETVAKAREIALRNEELDRFAYVVSHDLKEPLITINGYTKLVLDGAGDSLAPGIQEHVQSVMRASVRMKQLIDDLLTLSRVGRVPSQVTTVHVSRLLSDLLRDLEFTLHERHATVDFTPDLADVQYDPTMMSMVFRNLIVNGVKYNIQETPRITIGARDTDDMVEFTVTDNGIGIAVQDFAKVFMIFQRLDPNDGRGGTGAGLTITKKIVETYGGSIWIDSTEGSGSTIHFTVPRHG